MLTSLTVMFCLLMCRFSDAGNDDLTARSGDRRPKSAKARNRGGRAPRRGRGLYGDLGTGRDLAADRFAMPIRVKSEYNLDVMARMLLNGDFTFCPTNDSNDLGVARRAHSATSA